MRQKLTTLSHIMLLEYDSKIYMHIDISIILIY